MVNLIKNKLGSGVKRRLDRSASEISPDDTKSFMTSKASFNLKNLNKSGMSKDDTEKLKQDKESFNEQTKEQQSTSVNLIEWTYEYFMNRYGLKNVADKKFRQFIGSIFKFNQVNSRF
jgi:hypothetical protein